MPSYGLDHNALDRYITGNYGEDQYCDDFGDEGDDAPVMVEVTFVESGRVEVLTMEDAAAEFGTDELQEALAGHLPHVVVTVL